MIELFKKDLMKIEAGHNSNWPKQKDIMTRLAYIILCDQFSRYIYRGKAKAFSFDKYALPTAKSIVNSTNPTEDNISEYESLKLFERLFVVMPYIHSEDIVDCKTGCDMLEKIIDSINKEEEELMKIFMLYKCWS